MKTGLIVLAVVILIVIGAIGWAVGINNQLVAQEQMVNEKWAQVQNVYQRRADLVPNLVETVKGYAAQERTVLEEVTKARASVAGIKVTPELINDPAAFQKFQQAQSELGGALSRLLARVAPPAMRVMHRAHDGRCARPRREFRGSCKAAIRRTLRRPLAAPPGWHTACDGWQWEVRTCSQTPPCPRDSRLPRSALSSVRPRRSPSARRS